MYTLQIFFSSYIIQVNVNKGKKKKIETHLSQDLNFLIDMKYDFEMGNFTFFGVY